MFASPFGAGKTLFETAKSIEISDNGGKVLFLDRRAVSSKIKKRNSKSIQVVFFENGGSDNLKHIETEGINHVMVDEFFGDFAY